MSKPLSFIINVQFSYTLETALITLLSKFYSMSIKFNRLIWGAFITVIFSSAISIPTNNFKITPNVVTTKSTFLSLESLLKMNGRELSERLGEKISLKERIVFRIIQYKLGVQLKENLLNPSSMINLEKVMENGKEKFHFGGFLLGFFLGLLGVIIAYTAKREKAFIQSVWFGWGFLIFAGVCLYLILKYSV
jgi:hypothetical protein